MINLTTKEDTKSLYIDTATRSEMDFQIFIGSRGTGKTFTTLRQFINYRELGKRFIYLRNTDREAKIATTKVGNAFKSINNKYGTNIVGGFSSELGIGTFYDRYGLDDDDKSDGELIGYAFGLSTFAGVRSIDLSDVDTCVFEEFIPEAHIRKMKSRGDAFLNFIETANRNRELDGGKPIRIYLLANAIALDDEILMSLNATKEIEDMIHNKEKRRTIRERHLYIELVEDVGIVNEKRKGALYQLADKEFTESALTANFHQERLYLINKNFNQREYKPLISYDDYCIYQHKTKNTLHIAKTKEKSKRHLLETEIIRFRQLFRGKYILYCGADQITFDSYKTRAEIEKALKVEN